MVAQEGLWGTSAGDLYAPGQPSIGRLLRYVYGLLSPSLHGRGPMAVTVRNTGLATLTSDVCVYLYVYGALSACIVCVQHGHNDSGMGVR